MKKNKPLKKQLTDQFYRHNIPVFCIAILSALLSGTLNLILSWIMQQLIDAASGVPEALPIGTLAAISGAFVLLGIAVFMLDYVSLSVLCGSKRYNRNQHKKVLKNSF